ncbi:MAG: universal stress protein [Fimbriimonadales bacterium]|jgi:nucleotide-binding universal stress UspA family protein|nr:universal stress protein [Armatimonadota bacterium]MCX7687008.1 universal stress protein [Fimbriimonadales bacterium]CUU02407.1 Nucleotide-binding universal stress protein, UspA family [Armatimonadetes bacterium GBS]CUU36198.1 Nucleotide-binding universal stress protein, UspA family [Armatimonadetes bacterium DC]CUU36983.1 Nucleotide-binding universal stress protein, UspA family [Armatimonadetes bacterium GXS]
MWLPFKKILAPTDFSEPSYLALDMAIELADHFDAELHLLHVVPPLHVVPVPVNVEIPLYEMELKEAAERSMQEVMEQRIPKHLTTFATVVWGDPADEIIAYQKEKGIDLIVIATHGRSGWKRFVFGSVTEKVVRYPTCPVLTINAPEES